MFVCEVHVLMKWSGIRQHTNSWTHGPRLAFPAASVPPRQTDFIWRIKQMHLEIAVSPSFSPCLPLLSFIFSPSLSLSWLFWLVNYFIQHICWIDAWIIHQLHAATIIPCCLYLPGLLCSAKQFKVLLGGFLQRSGRRGGGEKTIIKPTICSQTAVCWCIKQTDGALSWSESYELQTSTWKNTPGFLKWDLWWWVWAAELGFSGFQTLRINVAHVNDTCSPLSGFLVKAGCDQTGWRIKSSVFLVLFAWPTVNQSACWNVTRHSGRGEHLLARKCTAPRVHPSVEPTMGFPEHLKLLQQPGGLWGDGRGGRGAFRGWQAGNKHEPLLSGWWTRCTSAWLVEVGETEGERGERGRQSRNSSPESCRTLG